jgi:hypothetical protein
MEYLGMLDARGAFACHHTGSEDVFRHCMGIAGLDAAGELQKRSLLIISVDVQSQAQIPASKYDFRPYLHIHDLDFRLLFSANKPPAGIVVGVTVSLIFLDRLYLEC